MAQGSLESRLTSTAATWRADHERAAASRLELRRVVGEADRAGFSLLKIQRLTGLKSQGHVHRLVLQEAVDAAGDDAAELDGAEG